MNEQEFAELAAGRALHSLTDAEEQRFADALAEHPEWAAVADADAETAAVLAEGLVEVAPPSALRAALLATIASVPQESVVTADAPSDEGSVRDDAVDAAASPARRRPLRILFALAACLVLLVGLGVGATVLASQLARPASVVALDEIEGAPDAQQATVELASGATATAHWSASLGSAVLVATGLEQLDADKTYELWYVRDDAPVSAGVFAAETGTTTALLSGDMRPGDVIALTIEGAGGSPTGAPTTDPIVVIPTA